MPKMILRVKTVFSEAIDVVLSWCIREGIARSVQDRVLAEHGHAEVS